MNSAQLTCPHCNTSKKQLPRSKNLAFCGRCQSTYITQPLKAWDSDIEDDDGHSVYIPMKAESDDDYTIHSLETPIYTRSQLKAVEKQKEEEKQEEEEEEEEFPRKGLFFSLSRQDKSLSSFTGSAPSSKSSIQPDTPPPIIKKEDTKSSVWDFSDSEDEEDDIFRLRQKKTFNRPSLNLSKKDYNTMFNPKKEDRPTPKTHKISSLFDSFTLSSDSEPEQLTQPKERSPPVILKANLLPQLNMFSDDDDDDSYGNKTRYHNYENETKNHKNKTRYHNYESDNDNHKRSRDRSYETNDKNNENKARYRNHSSNDNKYKNKTRYHNYDSDDSNHKTNRDFSYEINGKNNENKTQYRNHDSNDNKSFTLPRKPSFSFKHLLNRPNMPSLISDSDSDSDSNELPLLPKRKRRRAAVVVKKPVQKPVQKEASDELPAIFSDAYLPKPVKELKPRTQSSDYEFSDYEDIDFNVDKTPDAPLNHGSAQDKLSSIIRNIKDKERAALSARDGASPYDSRSRSDDDDSDSGSQRREALEYMRSLEQQKKINNDFDSQMARLYESSQSGNSAFRPQSFKRFTARERTLLRELLQIKRRRPIHRFNPYIMFNCKARKQLQKDNPNLNVKELSALVGQAWRGLDQETKQKLIEEAEAKRNLFLQSGGLGTDMKLKRPPNGYCLYSKDNMRRIRREHPELATVNAASRFVAEEWRALDPKIREEYDNKANALWHKWKEENPDEFERYKAQLKNPAKCKF